MKFSFELTQKEFSKKMKTLSPGIILKTKELIRNSTAGPAPIFLFIILLNLVR